MKRTNSKISTETHDLQVKLLVPKGKVPTRSISEAAGYDLYIFETIIIPPHTCILVSTYIAIQVLDGAYRRIAPRSGLAVKASLDISAEVIDQDYLGHVKIHLVNHSDQGFSAKESDRIAQLIL